MRSKRVCVDCGATSSCAWRRHPDAGMVCNKCGCRRRREGLKERQQQFSDGRSSPTLLGGKRKADSTDGADSPCKRASAGPATPQETEIWAAAPTAAQAPATLAGLHYSLQLQHAAGLSSLQTMPPAQVQTTYAQLADGRVVPILGPAVRHVVLYSDTRSLSSHTAGLPWPSLEPFTHASDLLDDAAAYGCNASMALPPLEMLQSHDESSQFWNNLQSLFD